MSTGNLHMTNKQIQIMKVIIKGNKDDAGHWSPVDLGQLIERIPYDTTKDSMKFSIRFLEKKGCVTKAREKRGSYLCVTYTPTELGKAMVKAEDQHWLETNPIS